MLPDASLLRVSIGLASFPFKLLIQFFYNPNELSGLECFAIKHPLIEHEISFKCKTFCLATYM